MDGKNFTPTPGAGDGVVGRRRAVMRHGESRRDAGGVERAAFECALSGPGAYRRGAHRAISNACAADAAARKRQLRGDGEDRNALRMHAGDFDKAERVGSWPPECDAGNEDSAAVAAVEKLIKRQLALANAGGERN